MTDHSESNIKDRLLSMPIIAVVVICFITTSAIVTLIINVYSTYVDSVDQRRISELAAKSSEVSEKAAQIERIKSEKSGEISQLKSQISQKSAEVERTKAEKSQEITRLTSEITKHSIRETYSDESIAACKRNVRGKEARIKELSAALSQDNDSQKDNKCSSYRTELQSLNAEIDRLKLEQIRKREFIAEESVEVKKNKLIKVLDEIDITLSNVTENKLLVTFLYTIQGKKYTAYNVNTGGVAGQKIANYYYLFHVTKSSADTPEMASIVVSKISISN